MELIFYFRLFYPFRGFISIWEKVNTLNLSGVATGQSTSTHVMLKNMFMYSEQ
jgi:hypothetical protein